MYQVTSLESWSRWHLRIHLSNLLNHPFFFLFELFVLTFWLESFQVLYQACFIPLEDVKDSRRLVWIRNEHLEDIKCLKLDVFAWILEEKLP